MLLGQVVHDLYRLDSCEKGNAGPIAKESQISVIGHYVHRSVPGDLRGRGSAGADVVHGADVASPEPDSGAELEHAFVGRVERCERE